MSTLIESEYLVYRWEDESMHFVRRLFLKHPVGWQVTPESVREAMEAEVCDFKPAKYRAIPAGRYVDLEVKAEVVFS